MPLGATGTLATCITARLAPSGNRPFGGFASPFAMSTVAVAPRISGQGTRPGASGSSKWALKAR